MENINEFQPKKYREFYSMQELVSAIGKTSIVWSWGANSWTKMNDKLLRFKVQAHRHRGHVFIADNGSDLFDIWLTTLSGKVKKEFTDIYIEDLISVIDNEIEKIPEYNY